VITALAIASIILLASSFLDGVSTVVALRNPVNIELDPVMVWVFGTNRPTASTIYVRGMSVIGLEIALAFLLAHASHPLGYLLVAGGLVQSGIHVWAAIQNFRLK